MIQRCPFCYFFHLLRRVAVAYPPPSFFLSLPSTWCPECTTRRSQGRWHVGYPVRCIIALYHHCLVPSLPCAIIALCHHCLVPSLPCAIIALCHHCLVPSLPCTIIALYHHCLVPSLPCAIIALCHHCLVPSLPCAIIALYHHACWEYIATVLWRSSGNP